MIPENEEPVCIFTDDLEGESMRGLMNLVRLRATSSVRAVSMWE